MFLYGKSYLIVFAMFFFAFFTVNLQISGWNVDLKVQLEDCNSYKNYGFQCSTSFSAVSTQQATAGSAIMISGAAIFGIAALIVAISRKRRVEVVDLDQGGQTGFEMMNDSGVRA